MANETSIISYVPQPYFTDGVATVAGYNQVGSVDNSAGIFDPDLSKFTTINANASVDEFAFQIDFNKTSGHLANANMSLGLIGCSLLTYEDSGGSPDLETEFSEDITCLMSCDIGTVTDELISYAHNSQDAVHTFNREAMPGIIYGGRSNVLFNGLGLSSAGSTGTVYVTIQRTSANALARPHAKLIVGHLFVGVDVVVTFNPNTFAWTILPENEKHQARDFGTIPSDGTLVKRSTGEIINIGNYVLIGSEITDIATEITASHTPNFLDLTKVNTSYPLLLNPYPEAAPIYSTLTVDEINRTARQNFFSIYGFMQDPLEVQTDNFRDGLNSEYRARFRIQETR